MAYDIFYCRQVQGFFSRDGGPVSARAAGGVAVLAALGALLLAPRTLRQIENRKIRREFGEGLDKTQEVQAISNADLVRIPRETWH
jgi:hypothetical protein